MNKNPYQPTLTFVGDHFAGRVYELTQEKTTVGRGSDNTLVIHHPSVSLVHCEILVNSAEVIVRDLGSANGSFVDGIRLSHQQSQLKSGQLVRLGAVTARLELKSYTDDATSSEMTAVHEHGRILRDQARERNQSKPQPPGMILDDGSDSGDPEKTLALPQSVPRRNDVDHFAPAPTVATPRKPSATTATKIVAVLAAGLMTLLVIWLARR